MVAFIDNYKYLLLNNLYNDSYKKELIMIIQFKKLKYHQQIKNLQY